MTSVTATLEPGQIVVGVDTHKDTNALAVLNQDSRRIGAAEFATTGAGIAAAIAWAQTLGVVVMWAIEGTGSYGAGLTRALLGAGQPVVEVSSPNRRTRRIRGGKTDQIDAEAAARSYLADYATATPKTGAGKVELLRITRNAKDSAMKARTAAMNELRAVIVTAPVELRDQLRGLTPTALVDTCAALRPAGTGPTAGARKVLRLLARRHQYLTEDITTLQTDLADLVRTVNPALLDTFAVGPDTAAALLIAVGDNPERLTHEAAFAALCGTSPIPASSGQTDRMRLNRGGNRQANAALHRIIIVRLAHHAETRAYMAAHLNKSGTNKRQIIRILKRYLARRLFPILNPTEPGKQLPAAA